MDFYVLSRRLSLKSSSSTDWLPEEGSSRGKAPACPKCGRYIGAMPLMPPASVQVKRWGKSWGDVAFGVGDELLISARTLYLFHQHGISGVASSFSAVATQASSRKRLSFSPPPEYFVSSICHGSAAVDDELSGVKIEGQRLCCCCRSAQQIYSMERLVLEEDTWHGEDLFIPRGLPGTVVATKRVYDLVKLEGLRNFTFIQALDFAF